MSEIVFLSYSFKDIRRVRRLRVALQLHGLTVWPDHMPTPGTPAWKAQVKERLTEAACIIAILSNDTLDSRWAMYALEYAQENGIPILPVLVDGNPGHILLVDLKGEDWFDLRWSRNYVTEVRSLVSMIQFHANTDQITVEINS